LFVVFAVTACGVSADYYCSWKLYDNNRTLRISGSDCYVSNVVNFRYRDVVERIEFGYGVKQIGKYAISRFSKLTSVVLPTTVKEIEDYAFCNCSSLLSISFTTGLLKIGSYVFSGCSSLPRVYIDGFVLKDLGNGVFKDCTSLREVTITDHWLFGVTDIGSYTFAGCTSLRKVILPSSVTRIYDNAFAGCTSLTELSPILGSVKEISRSAFAGCTGLESVTIPVNITKISEKAFQGCTNLKNVSIPGTVTKIEKEAFDGCTALENVIFRGDSDPCDDKAFTNCGNPNVCVFRTYSNNSFNGITVYPKATDPELDPLFAQENKCNQVAICSPNSGFLVERMNASEWISKYFPCGFGYCDVETGNHEWSTCLSTDLVADICFRNECKDLAYLRRGGWIVVLLMSGAKYQDFSRSAFVKTVTAITSNKLHVDNDLASEVDDDQNLIRLYLQVDTEKIAESMKTQLEEAVADPQCATKWGNVLCSASNITVVEKVKEPNAADHCYVSLFCLILSLIISIFSSMN